MGIERTTDGATGGPGLAGRPRTLALTLSQGERVLHIELSGSPDRPHKVVVAVCNEDIALRVQVQSVGPVNATMPA